MRKILIAVLLVVIGVALYSADARADKWKNSDVLAAIAVADAHWPASPCKGIESIRWIDQLQKAAEGMYVNENVTAYALYGCRVVVIWDVVWYSNPKISYLCTVLEHEFGHLAGYYNATGTTLYQPAGQIDHLHSPNPHDVMYPDTDHPMGDCLAAFPNPLPTITRRKHVKRIQRKHTH